MHRAGIWLLIAWRGARGNSTNGRETIICTSNYVGICICLLLSPVVLFGIEPRDDVCIITITGSWVLVTLLMHADTMWHSSPSVERKDQMVNLNVFDTACLVLRRSCDRQLVIATRRFEDKHIPRLHECSKFNVQPHFGFQVHPPPAGLHPSSGG